MFQWLKSRRRRRLVETPFPEEWRRTLEEGMAAYALLDEGERLRLHDDLRVLAAEKSWEGCGGLELTEGMKVLVSAQAALLLLGIEHDYYPQVLSILIYPSTFRVRRAWVDEDGLVHEEEDEWDGEAWYRGPVVLGWKEVREDAAEPGTGINVVLHEFAHQLDFASGAIDGTPLLSGPQAYRRWHRVMSAAFEKLARDADRGRRTVLDPYGAESPEEFFAVATECFFDDPLPLRRRHSDLYAVLRDYYRQDPAARLERYREGGVRR
jgi:Mlc titration factor MtfA (ptsG expression regulator)